MRRWAACPRRCIDGHWRHNILLENCLRNGEAYATKKSLEEEMNTLSHKQNDWLAPFQNWLKDAQSLDKIASDSDLFAKKVCAKEIFGSHLFLGEKTVRASAPKILNSLGEFGGNPWDALRASHLLVLEKPLSSVLVPQRGMENRLYQYEVCHENQCPQTA
ncbi:MAG: hypothetical protein HYV02_00365 [Deltaproteobacteria bacterium]|nr:hypothetical protein [Deltaproteobacteria bacterium]